MGEGWCTRSGSDSADLWREIWHKWRDIGPGIAIKKVRAHTSVLDIMRGRITKADREGNAAADKAAKEALAVAKLEAPADAYNMQLARAVMWGRWIVRYATRWVSDVHDMEAGGGGAHDIDRRNDDGMTTTRQSLGHETWANAKETLCRRCGRHSLKANPTPSFWREACRGTAAGRTMAAHTGNINEKWFWHHYSRSALVGRGFVMQSRGHIPSHMIDESKLAGMVPSAEVAAFRAHVGLGPAARGGGDDEDERRRLLTTVSGTTSTAADAATMIGDGGGLDRVRARDPSAEASGTRTVRQRVEAIERHRREQLLHDASTPADHAAASASAPAGGATQTGTKREREPADDDVAEGPEGKKRANASAEEEMAPPIGDPEPWMREPSWMPVWLHRKRDEGQPSAMGEQGYAHGTPSASSGSGGAMPDADRSHHMMNVGALLFCNRCGAYGLNRAGAKLTAPCVKTVSRDVKKRLERMRNGRHPITGAPIN